MWHLIIVVLLLSNHHVDFNMLRIEVLFLQIDNELLIDREYAVFLVQTHTNTHTYVLVYTYLLCPLLT